jgi:hypothetical protein
MKAAAGNDPKEITQPVRVTSICLLKYTTEHKRHLNFP